MGECCSNCHSLVVRFHKIVWKTQVAYDNVEVFTICMNLSGSAVETLLDIGSLSSYCSL